MKKLIVALLMFIPLQIVRGQDRSIAIQETPNPVHSWMIGLQVGGASLLASTANYEMSMLYYATPEQVPNYPKQINQGWNFDGNIYYMFSNNFGLGAKYSLFTFSTQNEFARRDLYYSYLYVITKQRQNIHFTGLSAISQQWLNKNQKLRLTETISAGYLCYRDKLQIDGYLNPYFPHSRALIIKNTWGIDAGLSLEYYPMSWLSIGTNAGFTYTRLNKVEINTNSVVSKEETIKFAPQPLSILKYSLSIRYHINH